MQNYSGTSLNVHLPSVAILLTWPLDMILIEALLIQYLRILPNADTFLFRKTDRFFGLSITWTVQNVLDIAHNASPTKFSGIDSTTGHYNSTYTRSSSLWLAYLARGEPEHAFVALNGTSMHYHAYQKYTRSL